MTKDQIEAAARDIAVRVAKNCGSVPNLTFPDIYLGLTELLAAQADAPVAEPVAISDVQQTAPERIWLNLFATPEDTDGQRRFPDDHEGITWCEDEVGDFDVQYVRADLATRPPAPEEGKDAARKPLTQMQSTPTSEFPSVISAKRAALGELTYYDSMRSKEQKDVGE